MSTVSVHEAKTHLARLLERVEIEPASTALRNARHTHCGTSTSAQ